MAKKQGVNIQDIKQQNKLLVLKSIATQPGISRMTIAQQTGLSKMAVGNLVSELETEHLVTEYMNKNDPSSASVGRKPICLKISEQSPCICGILIKRYFLQFIIGDISGQILDSMRVELQELTGEELLEQMYQGYLTITGRTSREVSYISISAIGPVDLNQGMLLNPSAFFGIRNLPIVEWFSRRVDVPVLLMNDCGSGAMAELMYGRGEIIKNYMYLHLWNGIGTGLVLGGQLYTGNSGETGEIGHMSISYNGPRCECGNKGCLELYANVENMRERIHKVSPLYPGSEILKKKQIGWSEIMNAANKGDEPSLIALEEYCSYVSVAVINTLKFLNVSTIIVGYQDVSGGQIIEKLLQTNVDDVFGTDPLQRIQVVHSQFGDNAPLIGTLALVAEHIFSGDLPLPYHKET